MMKFVEYEFHQAGPGFPLLAESGETVAADVPTGCVLRKSTNLVDWQDVASHSFTHIGPDTTYRIDCVTYTVPVTATLEIG